MEAYIDFIGSGLKRQAPFSNPSSSSLSLSPPELLAVWSESRVLSAVRRISLQLHASLLSSAEFLEAALGLLVQVNPRLLYRPCSCCVTCLCTCFTCTACRRLQRWSVRPSSSACLRSASPLTTSICSVLGPSDPCASMPRPVPSHFCCSGSAPLGGPLSD